ncbi:hypothetical protein [Compostibacter hankyongensis]|uniref:hypothetical protein n=1 Tax=Compostibacter hankyongensis TaxID=1007089 RepID=UPI0031E97C15
MKRIIISGLVAGIALLALSISGLYLSVWLFPDLSMQYFGPAFNDRSGRYMVYYTHPFVTGIVLSWFWNRFKSILTGSFITRGIEFGVVYALIASLPSLWMVYSAMSVSLPLLSTWFIFGLLQGGISGMIFEKTNP